MGVAAPSCSQPAASKRGPLPIATPVQSPLEKDSASPPPPRAPAPRAQRARGHACPSQGGSMEPGTKTRPTSGCRARCRLQPARTAAGTPTAGETPPAQQVKHPQPPPHRPQPLTVGAVTAQADDNEDFHGSPVSAQPSLPPLGSSAWLRRGIGPQHGSQRGRRGWAGGGGLLHAPSILTRGVPPPHQHQHQHQRRAWEHRRAPLPGAAR